MIAVNGAFACVCVCSPIPSNGRTARQSATVSMSQEATTGLTQGTTCRYSIALPAHGVVDQTCRHRCITIRWPRRTARQVHWFDASNRVVMLFARAMQLFVTGGYPSSTSALLVYAVDTSLWEPQSPMPFGRYGAVSGTIEPYLYVIGGSADASALLKYAVPWNPTPAPTVSPTPAPTTPAPTPLPSRSMAPTPTPTVPPSPVPTDVALGVWLTDVASMPYAQSYQSGAVVGSKFYITGGASPVSYMPAVRQSVPLSSPCHTQDRAPAIGTI